MDTITLESFNKGVKGNSVFCVQCGKWFQGRCAGLKKVSANIVRNFACKNVKRMLERQWSRKNSYVMKWKL